MPFERSTSFLSDQSARPRLVEPFPGAAVGFGFGEAVKRGEENDDLANFHARIQAALFGEVADHVARAVADGLAEDVDGAFVRDQDIHDHADGGGFAGAVGTEQAQYGALRGRSG